MVEVSEGKRSPASPNFKPTAIAFAFGMAMLGEAQGATINVGISCSLNDAIVSANDNSATGGCTAGDLAGTDQIILPASTVFSVSTPAAVYQTSLGISALPIISSDISIQGNGSTIQRMAGADPFRVLYIDAGGTLELNNVTISGGAATGAGPVYNFNYGGGIRNLGSLVLNDTTVSASTALRRGGGIHNRGSLTINNSEISGNTAQGMGGGGVANGNGGSLLIQNSSVSMNTGGAGGGIEGYFGETISIVNSSITLNGSPGPGSGGGMSVAETNVNITGSSIANNNINGVNRRGAGIQVFENNTATQNSLIITNSTITGNTGGDGVFSDVYTKIENSSITLNGGNGIEHRAGNGVFTSLTITGNTGVGHYSRGPSSSLTNSTVSTNGQGLRIIGASTSLNNVVVSNNSPYGGGYASVTGVVSVDELMVNSNTSTYATGGMRVRGDILALDNVTASSNTASNGSLGGLGIYHTGTGAITVDNIQVNDNQSTLDEGGLSISSAGMLTLTNTVVTGNTGGRQGGGVFVAGSGSVILDGIQIDGNSVSSASVGSKRGAGIFSSTIGSLSIINSNITNNVSDQCAGVCLLGGGLSYGSATIMNTTISGNTSTANGGGVFVSQVSAYIANSSITGNIAANGGGIYVSSPIFDGVNLTISANTATDQGGAGFTARNFGAVDRIPTLTNSTIYGNAQIGAFGVGGVQGPVLLNRTVIADSTGADCFISPFPNRSPVIGDDNWFEDASCDGAAQGVPLLGLLGNNGGTTLTHAPLLGSGLINAGGQCGVPIDQIGTPRSVCECDIGAFEILELEPDNTSCIGSFFVIPLQGGGTVIFDL